MKIGIHVMIAGHMSDHRSPAGGVRPATLQALEATAMPLTMSAAAMRNCLDIFICVSCRDQHPEEDLEDRSGSQRSCIGSLAGRWGRARFSCAGGPYQGNRETRMPG